MKRIQGIQRNVILGKCSLLFFTWCRLQDRDTTSEKWFLTCKRHIKVSHLSRSPFDLRASRHHRERRVPVRKKNRVLESNGMKCCIKVMKKPASRRKIKPCFWAKKCKCRINGVRVWLHTGSLSIPNQTVFFRCRTWREGDIVSGKCSSAETPSSKLALSLVSSQPDNRL